MNVFVLGTGRCGSETFARACQHMSNYTARHESHNPRLHRGVTRPYRSLRFPDNHIEVDNRLAWFLGTLEREYSDRAYYVHLIRRREEVARSLVARGEESILFAYGWGILQHYRDARRLSEEAWYEIGLQYWDTINDNIAAFLRDKPQQQVMWLHEIEAPFRRYWNEIRAEGDLEAAVGEWRMRHNATGAWHASRAPTTPAEWEIWRAALRQEIAAAVGQGGRFLLLDEEQLALRDAVPGRSGLPFPAREGRYWGPPADGEAAVRELERLRERGAEFMVVAWPAFWWLNHYRALREHLDRRYPRLVNSERAAIFDLRSCSARTGRAGTRSGG